MIFSFSLFVFRLKRDASEGWELMVCGDYLMIEAREEKSRSQIFHDCIVKIEDWMLEVYLCPFGLPGLLRTAYL